MTIDENIQSLRDELRVERETRQRENAGHETCVEGMGKMLTGIEAALLGSIHTKERGLRETVNTHDARLDDQLHRIKKIEDTEHACTGLTVDDVKKLKDMPTAADVKSGLSQIEKIMVYGSVLGTVGMVVFQLLKK